MPPSGAIAYLGTLSLGLYILYVVEKGGREIYFGLASNLAEAE